ncbi:uncharacterized protein [Drosophila virilis]|uniref:Uncharacterized protein n=1 Tax=Drosophila virilis TaxID=7244 RepID=B4LER4_DROVI|nr:uncharacterized protein LOC6623815 [Drosophila virilis]EDW70171.1 uncharacterized protein Dvir_GJ13656 [Drosophila virilis]
MDCRAAGLPGTPSTTMSTFETFTEELNIEEQSQLNLDEIYDQLEQMKQRALQLRKILVREQPAAAEYAKCLKDIELNGSQNVALHQVQLQTAKIVGQVLNLSLRLKSEGKHLKNLDCDLQHQKKQTQALEIKIEKLHKWPSQQQHRAGLCLDRYSDLSIRCCSVDDYRRFMEDLYTHYEYRYKIIMPLKCYKADRVHVAKRLKKARQMLSDSSQVLLQHSNELGQILHNYIEIDSMKRLPRTTCYSQFGSMLLVYNDANDAELK